MTGLAIDPEQIEAFIGATLRYATPGGYVSLRSFLDGRDGPPFEIRPVKINGAGLEGVLKEAISAAGRAAEAREPIVFCPPIAAFDSPDGAKVANLLEGFCLSVECDQRPEEARAKLEQLLGPATVVVHSGGEWADPETGELHPKVHLHWRLSEPAAGGDLALLKDARRLATELVGGDPTNISIVHPIRWAGSVHRKGAPKLARIEALSEDREIELSDALELLKNAHAAAGTDWGTGPAPDAAIARADGRELGELVRGIVTGEQLHPNLTPLAARLVGSGMFPGAAVNTLRGLMEGGTGPRDDRWQARYDEIPRAVRTAQEKYGQAARASEAPKAVELGSVLDPWEKFVVPSFPLQTLPSAVRAYVEMQAKSSGADLSAVAMAVLTACSAALDQQFRIKMKRSGDWYVRPRLWTLLVGDPSSKKTPVVNSATRALREIEGVGVAAHRKAYAQYKEAQKAKEPADEPPPPTRYILNNITSEKLGDILSHQNRGVLMIADELSGFIGSMDKYSGRGGGADRAMWLTAYNGGPFTIDRMSRPSQYVDNLAVSFLGGVQPDRLETMSDLTSDGLLQRFLPVMMRTSTFPEEVESDEPAEAFSWLIRALVDLPARTLGASDDALAEFEAFQREIFTLEKLEGLGSGFRSFLGKLTGVQGSLALLLHLLEDPRESLYDRVSGDAARAAGTILRSFVMPHAGALYEHTDGAEMEPIRAMASFVLTSDKQRFTASDFASGVAKLKGQQLFDIAKKVSALVAGGWLDEEPGTAPVRAWTVRAGLRESFEARAEQERQRKAEAYAAINRLKKGGAG